jgi:RimJ/RimL family protein N-acetyltransferase
MEALPPFTLSGQRVRLEPLSFDHTEALWSAASGPRTTFALATVPASREETRAYIASALALRDAGAAVPFAIIEVSAEAVVGCTRFGNIERWQWGPGHPQQRPADRPDAVEIGWTWLAERVQRSGLNREAKLLLLGHAFDHWRCHRVSLKTDARNLRSRAGIEGIGGKLDGVFARTCPPRTAGSATPPTTRSSPPNGPR